LLGYLSDRAEQYKLSTVSLHDGTKRSWNVEDVTDSWNSIWLESGRCVSFTTKEDNSNYLSVCKLRDSHPARIHLPRLQSQDPHVTPSALLMGATNRKTILGRDPMAFGSGGDTWTAQ